MLEKMKEIIAEQLSVDADSITEASSFKEDPFVKDFLTKAKENEQLIKEHARLQQNMAEK